MLEYARVGAGRSSGKFMAETNEKILVGRRDAAELLSVSSRTIDYLVSSKALRPRRIGARVLFLRSELETFARRHNSDTEIKKNVDTSR
jgi:excisionase family DNA binding protein